MKTLLLYLSLFLSTLGYAQQKELPVKSDIKKVTVYLQGAQVTRTLETTVPVGANTLVISNLPYNILESSIQVRTLQKDVKVLAVSSRLNYMDEQQKTAQISQLEAQKEALQYQIRQQQVLLEVYQEEESLLINNKNLGGTQNGVKIETLMQAADYYRQRLLDIKNKKLNVQQKIATLNTQLQKTQAQLAELSHKSAEPVREVLVKVSAANVLKSVFEMTYVVKEAGWQPTYDVRAESVSRPIEVTYKATIYQNTGEDWNDVQLTFSNADPQQSGVAPFLDAWRLDFANYAYYQSREVGMQESEDVMMLNEVVKTGYAAPQASKKIKLEREIAARPVVNQTTLEFTLNAPYTVKADGKRQTIDMVAYDLPATYQYVVVPKLDTDAFLKARITDWEEYNFLPGDANLFFEGKFIGKTVLDTQYLSDTLEISLGRDKNIVVTRDKVKEYSTKQFIGANRTEMVAWEISVRNKKQDKIDIIIEDQVPVSSNKSIEVSVEEYSKGAYNEVQGLVKWHYTLDPSENKKMILKYQVKYPKGQQLVLE